MQSLEKANQILRQRTLTIRKITKEKSILTEKLLLLSETNERLLEKIAKLEKMNSILVKEEEVFLKKETKSKKKNSYRKIDDNASSNTD